MCKKSGGFKYERTLQCNIESEFKSDATKLPEKHTVDVWGATAKDKHIHTVLGKRLTEVL